MGPMSMELVEKMLILNLKSQNLNFTTQALLGYLELHREVSTNKVLCREFVLSNHNEVISVVRKNVTFLKSRTHFSDNIKQEVYEHVATDLSGFLGSLLASSGLARNGRTSKEAIDLLSISAESDISYKLKLASVLFCSGEAEKVKQLCKQALRYELFKAVSDDINQRQLIDDWMFLAVVDCLPFSYYLEYKASREIGKCDLRKQSLHSLKRCITEDIRILFHVETAWNILGQCHKLEKQPVAALYCYRKSLDIRPRNNAAN